MLSLRVRIFGTVPHLVGSIVRLRSRAGLHINVVAAGQNFHHVE